MRFRVPVRFWKPWLLGIHITLPRYILRVFGLTGDETRVSWTPPSCVFTTPAPTTTLVIKWNGEDASSDLLWVKDPMLTISVTEVKLAMSTQVALLISVVWFFTQHYCTGAWREGRRGGVRHVQHHGGERSAESKNWGEKIIKTNLGMNMVCQGLNEEYAKIGVEVFKAFSDDIFGRIEILMAERHERRMNESSWWAIHNRASPLHF